MYTRGFSTSIHYWKCGQGHQNSTELTEEDRRQAAILLKCWVAGCKEKKAISGRISPSRIENPPQQHGPLKRFFSKS